MLEPAAHPVGGVGIERGGRLVEQQDFRAVEQRLGERDAGLLAGRELAGRPVEEFVELEIGGELGDARVDIGDRVKLGEHGKILPHREPHRQRHIGAFEIHPVQHAIALFRHLRAQHA